MRFIVDANILLHSVNAASRDHGAARTFLDEHWQAGTAWCTTWPVLYEFLRVSTHRNVFARPLEPEEALQFVAALAANPAVSILGDGPRHLESLAKAIGRYPRPAGSIYHDLHTVALMQEYGVNEIITADVGFHRFRGIKVTNPLAG